MFKNLLNVSSNFQRLTSNSILAAGGFHTEGLTERLKAANISYVLVRPEIGVLPEQIPYRDQMRGEVSWKEYFRVENGRINLYQAFVRAVRDKLLASSVERIADRKNLNAKRYPLNASVLKSWRDQILRDLAQQGRIEDSGRYTQFLDEILPDRYRQPQLFDLKARIRNFIRNLNGLEKTQQMTEQNIARLLTASTIPPALTGPGIAAPRSELRADLFPFFPGIQNRSEVRQPIQDLVFQGITAHALDVIEGEIETWEPEEKKLNISLVNPNDLPEVNETRINNEIRTVTELWQKLRQEFSGQVEFQAELGTTDALVVLAQSYINANGQKAEHELQESLERYKKPSQSLQLMINRLIEALRDRESLFASELVQDGGEEIKQQIIHRQRERLMIRIFDIFLNLPYGFNTKEPGMIKEEKELAAARRIGFLAIVPELLQIIEHGKPIHRAIKPMIEKLEQRVRFLKPGAEAARLNAEQEPDNAQFQKRYMFLQKNLATIEEQINYLQAVAAQFDTYDFIHDRGADEDEKKAKKAEERDRHQKILSATLKYFPEMSELLLTVKEKLESFLEAEIQKGRPIEYGTAKFFYKYYEEHSKTHPADAAEPEVIDFLMRYYDIAKHGDQERESDQELIVFAKKIRHEMDYAQLLGRFREKGRVVAIVSPTEEGEYRIPHWYIFAQKSGILVISFLDLEERHLQFSDIRKGDTAMVDGKTGNVVINPSGERREAWLTNGKIYRHLENYFLSKANVPAQFEGKPVSYFYDETSIAAFRDRPEGSVVSNRGGIGVKLFRLEELLVGEMDRQGIELDEARLRLALSDILSQSFFADHPIVFRLFDVEPDKRTKFLVQGGWDLDHVLTHLTGVRFYLSKEEKYRAFREFGKMQLRAIFGARMHKGAKASEVGMLFPDVRNASEVAAIDELIQEARDEFILNMYYDSEFRESLAVDVVEAVEIISQMPLGYMLENTSVVEKQSENIMQAIQNQRLKRQKELSLGRLLPRFIGIGTNDLTKSIIEARLHGEGALPDVLNSDLIRDIWSIGDSAKKYGLEVNLEGEWGGSIRMLLILLALRGKPLGELEIMPVAGINRVPELLEHARNIKRGDLMHFENLIIRAVLEIDPPTPEELDSVSHSLVSAIYTRIIDSYEFNRFVDTEEENGRFQQRSELRRAAEDTVRILARQENAKAEIPVLAQRLGRWDAKSVTRELVWSWVRERKTRGGDFRFYPRVSREAAQVAAVRWLKAASRLADGSQTLAFDVTQENPASVQTLLDALLQPGIVEKLRQAVFVDEYRNGKLRTVISARLKGSRTAFEFLKALLPQRLSVFLFGQKILPLITNQRVAPKANPFTVQIGVTGKDGSHDPNLEFAEMTLRQAVGLHILSRIKNAEEWSIPSVRSEIRAELLKELFDRYSDSGNILHFDQNGHVTVSRSELRRYLTGYFAQQQFASAA